MTIKYAIALAASFVLAGSAGQVLAQDDSTPGKTGGQPQGITGTQDESSEQSGQSSSDDASASNQILNGKVDNDTSVTPTGPGGRVDTGPAGQAPDGDGQASPPRPGPDQWMEAENSWATFNGDLRAQKYSPATQITPDNVGNLEQVWEYHTGDVSDGSGDVPMTVWSATPLFVNDTLYLGTPFYRIIALEPDTGQEKWTFDPEARLEALTQPNMKNRGVAYWQADEPQPGEPCQKIVYIGTMDAKLYGVDADTGEPCANFGDNGMVNVNQWNTVNDKWPLSLLQPPTVYNDTLFLGWAGKDWTDAVAPPGTVFALDARTGERR